MKIDWLENEQAREAFSKEQEREREHNASEGLLHERQEFDPEKGYVDGFRQNEKDITPEEQMHEIFQMENAYGKISLGMNKLGETVLSVRREKYNNGPSAPGVSKEVNQADSYRYIGRGGEKELNKKTPENSAYALLSRNREGDVERLQGDILMKESERFGERTGQHTLSTLLPMRTGEPENDREAYTMHQTLAHRMEMAIRENRAKLKNNDESERSEIPDERILIIPGLTDDETETDTPEEEAPDENASDKPLEESKK